MDAVLIARQVRLVLEQNSSTILTGVGVVGTIGTAVLTGRATFRAAEIFETERRQREATHPDANGPYVAETTKEKVKRVWPLYIPPVAAGAITVSSIVLAHRIDAKKIVALTAASGLAERALREYKDKVFEKMGAKKAEEVRAAIKQDQVDKNPPKTSQVVAIGDGTVLCMDAVTGRYFFSTAEDLRRAENVINHELVNYKYVSLTRFYDEIGLAPTSMSDAIGWNDNNMMSVAFDTVLTPDKKPCLVVDFDPVPFAEFHNLHD